MPLEGYMQGDVMVNINAASTFTTTELNQKSSSDYIHKEISATEIPELVWHLHGHYNDQLDESIREESRLVFDHLSAYLSGQGHKLKSKHWEKKNGPHPAGSWDIYVKNSAIGDATIWMSLNRPLNVPAFFHPVLALHSEEPSAAQEADAHTRGAIVFGMPVKDGGEHVDWKTQIDWNWVKKVWLF
ncbi:MAG: hypothetical protein CMO81_05005 [Waddliaceae bacterium]|nr:hypothetical protein [Waddliaceae bacterium]